METKVTEVREWVNQVAIITGGADGLGFALAQRLVLRKVRVVLWDINPAKLQIAESKLGALAFAQQVDVTQEGEVKKAVEQVLKQYGQVDILVNCAGITGKTGIQTHQVALADFDRVMNLNVRGILITVQSVLGAMLERNYGRILNIASISGKEGNAGMLAYSTSKAAVIGMTKVMGKEYAQTGVRINALAPAVIRTELVAALPEEQVRYMTNKIPMDRCGTLEEFAAMAEFIVSPENSFTTAFTFDLSGGRAVY